MILDVAGSTPVSHPNFHKRIEISKQISLWLAPPEYVIVRKLEFFREGASDKHLRDIRNMLLQIEHRLDMAFLHEQLSLRGLETHWQKVTQV